MKSLLGFLSTLFLLILLTFFLLQLIPGTPFSEREELPTVVQEQLATIYGLNKPLPIQLFNYFKAAMSWDFGPSLSYPERTVREIIAESFPISALLGVEALSIALILGTAVAIIATLKPESGPLLLSLLTALISIPSFMIASLLQYLFCLKKGGLPIACWGTPLHTLLPAFSLALMPAANIARLLHTNLSQSMKKSYIRTARAKGLSQAAALIKHGLRNSFPPLLPYLGQLTTAILVGSFVIEQIFAIPGLGKWFVLSVSNRDYSVIMGLTLFYAELLLFFTWLADLIYARLTPHLQREQR